MERKPGDKDKPESGRYSEAWWSHVAADREAELAERQRTWGGIDELLIVRYETGRCTEEEKARVEQAMQDFPAVRESIAIGRELDAKNAAAPCSSDDAGQKRSGERPWSDLADRPQKGPDSSR
jgi:hypothetical protein